MKFLKIKECPFCGCTTFYQKFQYRGRGIYFSNYDGSDAENGDMYDYVNATTTGRAYCAECDRYLGNAGSDVLGKQAEKAMEGKK